MRVWLLCWSVCGVDRRLKDDKLCSLSLGQRSSKVRVANTSGVQVGSSVTTRTVSTEETDVEVVMSVNGATRAIVLFCKAISSPFPTDDFVGWLK